MRLSTSFLMSARIVSVSGIAPKPIELLSQFWRCCTILLFKCVFRVLLHRKSTVGSVSLSRFLFRDHGIACRCDIFSLRSRDRVYRPEMKGQLLVEKFTSEVRHENAFLLCSWNVPMRSYEQHSYSICILCDRLVSVLNHSWKLLKFGVDRL